WIELGGIAPQPRWSARMVAAAGVVVLMIGLLPLKLAQLQVYDSSNLAALAHANTVHRTVLEADRGIIYDRHGVALVQNTPVWNLEAAPAPGGPGSKTPPSGPSRASPRPCPPPRACAPPSSPPWRGWSGSRKTSW